MDIVVLIPGIMGTRLSLPAEYNDGKAEEVWPPRPLEVAFGYDRIDKLQHPNLQVGAIIDSVSCYGFYSTIQKYLDDLGYTKDGVSKKRIDFGYDWRRDNFDTAEQLARVLDATFTPAVQSISLVCHSMGGQIARLLLESGRYDHKLWFKAIKQFVALATPHLGAPLALARIFGLDSSTGVSGKDFAKLAANPLYPSGYQLIPAPNEAAIWDQTSADLAALDPYDPVVAKELGMDPNLVNYARAVHAILSKNIHPAHVRYFYFAGTGHRTVTRINVYRIAGKPINHGSSVITVTPGAGDGTVPLYSALPVVGQRQIVVNDHATVFKGMPFLRAFVRLFGGDEGAVIEAVESADEVEARAVRIQGSLDKVVYVEREKLELTLALYWPKPSLEIATTDSIEGAIEIVATDEQGNTTTDALKVSVSYQGGRIDKLTMTLPTKDLKAGIYRLRFRGTPAMSTALVFVITKPVSQL
jgi:pimeloyl-ACP methyl ester carboxylesterase